MKLIPSLKKHPLVSVLRIEGIIQSSSRSRPYLINDSGLTKIIEQAFKKGKPKAVALAINCPGGSPVQASLIGARIKRLSQETDIPVYAFVEDLAASGGYWLAVTADRIYADSCSIVGSIGVISGSFGFHELLAKSGIERRLYTSGKDKSLLDPFLPEKTQDVERLKEAQEQIHQEFIAHVKSSRGDVLADGDLFTGRFWIGHRAVELGLIDEVGHLAPVMKEKFGDKVKFRFYGPKGRLFSQLGMGALDAALIGLEERAMRARFGF